MRHVVLERRQVVAFGIDGDEQGLHPFAVRPQRLQRRRHGQQVGRAEVRAEGVAEIDEREAAPEGRVRHRAPVMVGQRERPAEELFERRGRSGRRRGGGEAEGGKRRRNRPDRAARRPRHQVEYCVNATVPARAR